MEFIVTGICLITALYLITQPLFGSPRPGGPGSGGRSGGVELDRLDSLQARKRLLEENLNDLEFEFQMGKLNRDDFERLQAGCTAEAGQLQQDLARLEAGRQLEERIEQDIQKRRKVG